MIAIDPLIADVERAASAQPGLIHRRLPPDSQAHYVIEIDGVPLRYRSLATARLLASLSDEPVAVLFGPHYWRGVRTVVG